MGIQSANNSLRNFKLGLFLKGGNPSDTLKNGLLWYYQLEEAAGNRLDSSLNNLTLTENGIVAQAPGIIDLAADFFNGDGNNLANTYVPQYSLTDFTVTGWVYFNSKTVNQQIIYIGLGGSGGSNVVLRVLYNQSIDSIRGEVARDNSSTANVNLQIEGTIPTDKWIFFAFKHEASTKELTLRLDSLPEDVDTYTTGVLNDFGNQGFALGSNVSQTNTLDGRVDEVGGWDRLLTDKELDFLAQPGRPDFQSILEDDSGNILEDDAGNILIAN